MHYTVGRSLQVYHQERTITKYLYQEDLPEMSEMSLCFWIKLESDDDNRKDDWLVNIAWSGTVILNVYYSFRHKCMRWVEKHGRML